MSLLKQKLAERALVTGMHITLGDACVSELCASLGYDFLWIDTEHTALDYHQLEMHLIAAKAGGTQTLVRIPWNDPILAKRVLEMGPDGIIFPMVNTPQELERAMDCCLYPPLGNRGFGPRRAVRYGLDNVDDYICSANKNLVRCVQVETATAVEHLYEMAQNPYVDCFIFGPCDLSGSIGELNRVFDANTTQLIDKAVKILQAAGKSVGVSTGSTDPQVLRYWREKGLNFISAGTDYLHILSTSQQALQTLKHL